MEPLLINKGTSDLDISAKVKNRLANSLLLLGSIVCCLVVAEGATRFFLGDSIVLFPRYVTEADYDGVRLRRLIPNSTFWHTSIDGSWQFRVNGQGFRDDEDYEFSKPLGRRRVLVLGDSHTQGFEARQEAIFPKVLERRLRARGVDAQVLNTGISGFGTAEQLMFLEHEGMKYHPDAVVLAFFANDFDDSAKSGLYELTNGKLLVRKTNHTPGVKPIALMNAVPTASWLSQNSYLFSLLVNIVWEAAKKALSVAARKQLITEYAISPSQMDDYQRDLVVALLGRMKAVAHAADIPFIVVEIPFVVLTERVAWLPSLAPDLVPAFIANCDLFLPTSSYLGNAQKGTVFVPHGTRHISEQTHARIAEALDRILGETDSRFRSATHPASAVVVPGTPLELPF